MGAAFKNAALVLLAIDTHIHSANSNLSGSG